MSSPVFASWAYRVSSSVHTWSHPYLTTLTNEQIVAELGWTAKAIKEVTGVTPNTVKFLLAHGIDFGLMVAYTQMRPPYGDIEYDNFFSPVSPVSDQTP